MESDQNQVSNSSYFSQRSMNSEEWKHWFLLSDYISELIEYIWRLKRK